MNLLLIRLDDLIRMYQPSILGNSIDRRGSQDLADFFGIVRQMDDRRAAKLGQSHGSLYCRASHSIVKMKTLLYQLRILYICLAPDSADTVIHYRPQKILHRLYLVRHLHLGQHAVWHIPLQKLV